uniref:Ubiquitin-like domain-containing protein n=1 Tax=Alexandrium catenella TaxID=2925 RepID=A0A7S1LSZ8_ALECA
MKVEVVANKKTLSMDLAGSAKFGELMKALNIEEGIDVAKQVFLYDHKQIRMPSYEGGKLVVYDGKTREVTEDKTLADLKIDGSEPLVCGELQDEWLEDMKWGAFSHTIYEADYLKHREFIVFNAQQQH